MSTILTATMSKVIPWKQTRHCYLTHSTIRRFLHCQKPLNTETKKHTSDGKTTSATKTTTTSRTTSTARTQAGAPISNFLGSMTVGEGGPMVLQDTYFLERMQHVLRERIPERFVHAKGAGAHGNFVVTDVSEIKNYCKADLFSSLNKTTKCMVRFSTTGGEAGSSDNERDARGFAIKFYTEQGIWDLLCLSTPVFFIRDPILFPHLVHAQKRNPSSNLKDANTFWDFMTKREETVHMLCMIFADRGIPDGYQHMNGFAGNTYTMVNNEGKAVYVKFKLETNRGVQNIIDPKDVKLSDPDYSTRKLYDAIKEGSCLPSWDLCYQVMTFDQAQQNEYKSYAFDVTQIWPYDKFPLKKIGTLTLDKNPSNYFAEVEQVAFNPSRMVPGIEPSPDLVLQGRMFAYNDTQIHRVGVNYNQLPVNRPQNDYPPQNYERSGAQTIIEPGEDEVNYYPNSFNGPQPDPNYEQHSTQVMTGELKRYDTGQTVDNFEQAITFYDNVLGVDERGRLAVNIAANLEGANTDIQMRTVEMFTKVNDNLGTAIDAAIKASLKLKSKA